MSQLLRFPSSVKRDPAIEIWMHKHSDELAAIAHRWFEVMRNCGDDATALMKLVETAYTDMKRRLKAE
jgi:hypothetical protein